MERAHSKQKLIFAKAILLPSSCLCNRTASCFLYVSGAAVSWQGSCPLAAAQRLGWCGLEGREVMKEMRMLLERGVGIVAASGERSHFAQTQIQIIQELRASIFCLFFPFHAVLGVSSPRCSLCRGPLGVNARFIILAIWNGSPVSQEAESPDFSSSYLCAVVIVQLTDYHL